MIYSRCPGGATTISHLKRKASETSFQNEAAASVAVVVWGRTTIGRSIRRSKESCA
jgi:hypothetical protein